MNFYNILAVIFLLSVSCTNKSSGPSKAKTKLLSYKSAIKYQYEPLSDPSHAAMVNGQPIEMRSLLGDVALKELQDTYDSQAFIFAYGWGKMLEEKKQGPVELVIFGREPVKERAKLLSSQGIDKSDRVKVSFSQEKKMGQLAFADGQKLSWSDFHSANISHSKLYEKLFNQRMQKLNGMVVRRYLLEASRKADMAMEAYVQKNILQGSFEPSVEDVKKFAEEKGIAPSDLNEKMIERLKAIVSQNYRDEKIEKYVSSQLIKTPIKVGFLGPEHQVKAPKLSAEVPQWNGKGAPDVFFIGHWNCDNCSDPLNSFLELKKSWGKRVNGAFIYSFPERDREARMGAEAALCVHEQQEDSFWTFTSYMLSNKDGNIEENLNEAAKSTGVDFEQFRQCFLQRKHQQKVDSHLVYAKNMGVNKAPLFLLGGEVVRLPASIGHLGEMLKKHVPEQKKKSFFAKIKAFFSF